MNVLLTTERQRPQTAAAGVAIAVAISMVSLIAARTQQRALRIVVIEGNNAVNIIQQKTAVAPLVEVRDRNDLPVSGVPVTFTLTGAKTASFPGGTTTLTVTTNSAGRATAAGLNLLGSGTVEIDVTASVQGQTAIASIVQTNYATLQAAQAAGAAGTSPSSAGVAAGGSTGGGGLSGLAIGVIAGSALGGGLAAAQLLKQEENEPTSPVAATPAPCPNPPSGRVTLTANETLRLSFTVPPTPAGDVFFVPVNAGAGVGSGIGSTVWRLFSGSSLLGEQVDPFGFPTWRSSASALQAGSVIDFSPIVNGFAGRLDILVTSGSQNFDLSTGQVVVARAFDTNGFLVLANLPVNPTLISTNCR